jgi:hypothetical protein
MADTTKIIENQPFLPWGEPFSEIFVSWLDFRKARQHRPGCICHGVPGIFRTPPSSEKSLLAQAKPWGAILSVDPLNLEDKMPADITVIEYNIRLLANFAPELFCKGGSQAWRQRAC